MNVVFYSSIINDKTESICRALEHSGYPIGLELHHSIGSLESRLRQPLNGIVLVLLYTSTHENLSHAIVLKELLYHLPVILIMHDTGRDAMVRARILRPRFIFGADDNLEDMRLVLEKIIAGQKAMEKTWL
ncbi:MAG: hypothetical protein CSYNP_00727 [Syntrophus sp. SKADARSKE-3]|nr:hypothetical protein [Syntrophus sp. SKADARSKE-3]